MEVCPRRRSEKSVLLLSSIGKVEFCRRRRLSEKSVLSSSSIGEVRFVVVYDRKSRPFCCRRRSEKSVLSLSSIGEVGSVVFVNRRSWFCRRRWSEKSVLSSASIGEVGPVVVDRTSLIGKVGSVQFKMELRERGVVESYFREFMLTASH